MKGGGSDFVTAPELSPLFGATLASALAQALEQTGTDELWEFGAGSGALAEQGDITLCHGQPLLNPLCLDSADRLVS